MTKTYSDALQEQPVHGCVLAGGVAGLAVAGVGEG